MTSYNYQGNCTNITIPPPIARNCRTTIELDEDIIDNFRDPKVWSHSYWFMLHLGSISAPEMIPPSMRTKYWNYIEGIPVMIPCHDCAQHAQTWVDNHRVDRDQICSSRSNLVKFFVDLHNDVNRRTGKPIISEEQVYKMFSGPVSIRQFRYS